MTRMSGATALIKSLKQYGIDTIFALPGAQLDPIFDALYHEKESIKVIQSRHEQGTAYMAFGFSQSTGRVGTNLVVPGPGLLNAAAGLSTAFACGAKVLCLAGQIPSKFISQGIGQLHELSDQPGSVASVTKWRDRVEKVEDTPQKVREVFKHLNTGRVQPVLLEMAPDIMAMETDVSLIDPVTSYSEVDPQPDPDLIEKAAAFLGNSENPGIFIGGGIWGAEDSLLALAEELQAPVFVSPHGHGAIDSRHYLCQNLLCAKEIWDDIDVILAVGTRYQAPASWSNSDTKKLVRIDIDANQSVSIAPPDVHIISSARSSLKLLAGRIQRHNRKRGSRFEELNALKTEVMNRFNSVEPQFSYNNVIREELPEDGIAVFGVTQLGFAAWFGFPTYKPRTLIHPGYQGTLGYAFPTALGAQVANPSKKVVAVSGDGGFMFNLQELSTAVKYNINVVTIVMNDGAFGNVKRNQKEDYGGRMIGVELENPDFMKLADSFGVMGQRVDSPEGLKKALNNSFKEDGPCLIEVTVGEMPSMWEHMPLVRAKDQTREK
ncbi:MAG: thiamine pyrophosphate-dependent enzyme [Pseudomonadota bacterium]|nr:thiamine pyrophosphate-dependent enzyme [Pseudomonadota bacterium]